MKTRERPRLFSRPLIIRAPTRHTEAARGKGEKVRGCCCCLPIFLIESASKSAGAFRRTSRSIIPQRDSRRVFREGRRNGRVCFHDLPTRAGIQREFARVSSPKLKTTRCFAGGNENEISLIVKAHQLVNGVSAICSASPEAGC